MHFCFHELKNSSGVSEQSTYQGGNLASISVTVGKLELEQMVQQMTFTRSESKHLMALLQSRTIEEEESPSHVPRTEASTKSGSPRRNKHGNERDNFDAAIVNSRVLREEIASPGELAVAQAQTQQWINTNPTGHSKAPIASHITSIYDDNVVCVDGHGGHIHWLGCTGENIYSDRILAFDLGSETFREIPLPHSIQIMF